MIEMRDFDNLIQNPSAYGNDEIEDPVGPTCATWSADIFRVKRGGLYNADATQSRSASRRAYKANSEWTTHGFRLVVMPSSVLDE